MFIHIRSGHLAARALGAVRLLEQATTPAEREAAERFARKLAAQGVVAEAIEIPVPADAPARLSDDGVLLVRGAVWWRGVVLAGVAGALGFDQRSKPLEMSEAGAWRMWFAGPPRAVADLKLLFALVCFLIAVASHGFDLSHLKPQGEGTKQLVAFMGLAGLVFGKFVEAGKAVAWRLGRFWMI